MIDIKIVNKSSNEIPKYMTKGSVGFDISSNEDFDLHPECFHMYHTGLYFEIPEGYELQIRPRSGFANKNLTIIPNSPGTIDSDYRGELHVGLLNLHRLKILNIKKGDRIAQGIIAPIVKANFIEVKELSETERGAGGFGSTGK